MQGSAHCGPANQHTSIIYPLCRRIVSNYFSFIWSWNFQLQMMKNNYIYEGINIFKLLILDELSIYHKIF